MKKLPDDAFPKEEVRSAIRAGIKQAEDHRNMKVGKIRPYNIKRKMLYALGSVAAVFLILIASSYYSPAIASSLSQIPIIGSIFGDSDLIGLKQAYEKGLTSEIGETQTVNDISVTLKEILYDQNNITIGFYIESKKDLGEYYFGAGANYTINGKHPSGSTGSYGEEILTETARTAIQEINVTDEMPEKFDLGLVLHGKDGEKFYFTTSVQKIASNKIPIQHTQTVDGLTLTIEEIAISESGLGIAYESVEEETDFDLARGGYIEFRIVDQDGNEILGYSGGASGELVRDKIIFKSNKQFDPLDSKVTSLTITPYLELPSAGGGVEIDENGMEKEIEFKGHLIEPIEFKPFTVDISQ